MYEVREQKFLNVHVYFSLITWYAFVLTCSSSSISSIQNILTHSYSKVVLETILDAHKSGFHLHIWVTESQPDASGKLMFEELKKNGVPTTLVLDSCVGYWRINFNSDNQFSQIRDGKNSSSSGWRWGSYGNWRNREQGWSNYTLLNERFSIQIGTVNVCVIAKARHVPVYVCAETIKFVREFPLNQADIPQEFKVNLKNRQWLALFLL